MILATRNASVELFRIFRAPIVLDVLEARARWKPDGRALEVTRDHRVVWEFVKE